jgi:hypothetical protein
MSYTISQAHEAAIKTIKNDHSAAAVTVEFISLSGLTKYLRVWRSDQVEVMDTIEQAEAA